MAARPSRLALISRVAIAAALAATSTLAAAATRPAHPSAAIAAPIALAAPATTAITPSGLASASLSPGAEIHESWVHFDERAGDFALARDGRAADIIYADRDARVVAIAARDLANDIVRVTGTEPRLRALGSDAATSAGAAILIGTLGANPIIEGLVRAGKLPLGDLQGSWESFVITVVNDPAPGIRRALIIVGSDRRGTAYGVYELSQAMGISPWHWWADVPPRAQSQTLFVAADMRRFGPPAVKYRGIFINDEDWGLRPWAAKTFDSATGNIGPKTYGKIFELLLRLKANTLWPAMHPGTTPFNAIPENRQLADDYAIVMGSSHAEPMLRNNVGEWTSDPHKYNYVSNREGVRSYWEQRVRENSRYENLYTLGMRGIHDSNMQGPKTDAGRIKVLQQVFSDQRAMLARHVNPNVEQIPQAFVAYKEVLGLYRQGLKVPDDVTIVWPDDNFGYIRNYATDAERQRKGGFGVYYHLSYLGRPLSYLWLNTTPPALIYEEMHKAYEHGARTLWIANVGDLKPAEIGMEYFLQLAWDAKRPPAEFLIDWASREFGEQHAREIAEVMTEYYRLNVARKPEHLQWWLPKESPRASGYSPSEITQRLDAFTKIRAQADRLYAALPGDKRDAFFELVAYPVRGATLANQRYFFGEQPAQQAQALAADTDLVQQTRLYNEEIAHGKWRHIISLEPADGEWSSMRIARWELPKFPAAILSKQNPKTVLRRIDAGAYAQKADQPQAAWQIIPGLGSSGSAVTVSPSTAASIPIAEATAHAPHLDYNIDVEQSGRIEVTLYLLPTRPLRADRGLRLAIGLDDRPPTEVDVRLADDSPEWSQAVLSSSILARAKLPSATAGAHQIKVYMIDAGVVLDRIAVETPMPATNQSR
jgi:hypothetical protein